jgi:hypothetical protein
MTAHWRKLLGKICCLKICCLIFTVPIDSDVYFDCWFVLSLKQTSSLELQRNSNAAARKPDAVLFATVSS